MQRDKCVACCQVNKKPHPVATSIWKNMHTTEGVKYPTFTCIENMNVTNSAKERETYSKKMLE
jgi:hypothetical protein